MTAMSSSGWQAELRTGLGKLEIGIADGAGYDLAVSGPKVDPGVSLDDPRTTFFRDPASHRAADRHLRPSHRSGRVVQLRQVRLYQPRRCSACSWRCPSRPPKAKELPFLNAGPHVPGRQADIWEGALRYETDLGPASLSAYGALPKAAPNTSCRARKASATWARASEPIIR